MLFRVYGYLTVVSPHDSGVLEPAKNFVKPPRKRYGGFKGFKLTQQKNGTFCGFAVEFTLCQICTLFDILETIEI